MNNRRATTLLLLSVAILVACFTLPIHPARAQAQSPEGFQIIPPECLGSQKPNEQPCDLNSLLQLFVNLAGVGLKILPFLAMIMIIWAGYDLIMAGGNPEKIQGGKRSLTAVVVGVIIVIVLAWAFSYFVVFVLTNSTNVFPGYEVWEKEWWGGGTASTSQTPAELGCCTVDNVGCASTTQTDCDGLESVYPGKHTYTPGSCFPQFQAFCTNLGSGCCVPPDAGSLQCYTPALTESPKTNVGCLSWPGTTINPTSCDNIAGCTFAGGSANGCCTIGSKCMLLGPTGNQAYCTDHLGIFSADCSGPNCSDPGGCCIVSGACEKLASTETRDFCETVRGGVYSADCSASGCPAP